MADFLLAFDKTIANEGGYILETVQGDTGGMTYAGIARNPQPNWSGWSLIDKGIVSSDELHNLVKTFYEDNFWKPIKGDNIQDQDIAFSIYDFGVNAGIKTSIKLIQAILKITPIDGIMGNGIISLLNQETAKEFIPAFALAKIARYCAICNRDKTQSKFLLGWINRALRGVL